MTIKALIVDDEQLARDELQYLLGSIDDVEVVAQGKNGIEAIALVPRLEPDVLFLDVQMPGLDGFAVLRKLLEKTGPETLPQIIFATAFDKYAVRAFEVNAVDYLLKPFDRNRLEQALERVRARLQSPAQSGFQSSHDPQESTPRAPSLSREQVDSLIRLIEQQSGSAPTNGRSSKIVVQAGTRMLLVDQKELCFAAIDEGIISVSTPTIEIPVSRAQTRRLRELFKL
jgi:two-component system response regulator LytT